MQFKSLIKQPEELMSWDDMLVQFGDFLPKKMKHFLEIERPIEFKPTFIVNPLDQKNLEPYSDVWFKIKGNVYWTFFSIKTTNTNLYFRL